MNIVSNMAVFSSQREIFDLPVCDLDWPEALLFVSTLADVPIGQTIVSFLNANNADQMISDPAYGDILARHLVMPDGVGLDFASLMLHGKRFPANLNGTDFVPALLTYISSPKKIGLIGASPDVLARARDAFEEHAPWHKFIAVHDGYFREEENAALMERLARERVDILLVAMGTPRQEKWVDRYVRPEHARLVLSVGALFDFMAKEYPRAPGLVRKLRLEWFYRFTREPGRLWHRYFIGGPQFVLRVIGRSLLKSMHLQPRSPGEFTRRLSG